MIGTGRRQRGAPHFNLANILFAAIGIFVLALNTARADSAQYFYDFGGRLIGVIDPVNGSARYNYDKSGNITSIVKNPITTLTVFQVTPNSGAIGATVTIAGTGFGTVSNTSVGFNGTSATPSAVSSTSITVNVPTGATTGPVSVTTPAGTVTMPTSFVVGSPSAPTITSFTTGTSTPTIATIGESLTITGTNFDTTYSKVAINGQFALITSASSTSLTVTVPPASSGKIVVETPAGSVTSSSDLIIAPPPFATTAVTSERTTIGSSPVTISVGGSGTAGLALFDASAGQRITVFLDDSAMSGCPFITVLMPSGAPFAPGVTSCADNYYDGALVTPQTGTYSVELQPTASSGSFAAQILSVPADATASATIGGSAETISITTPGQNASFTFSGTSGQKVSLLLNFTGMSSCSTYTVTNPDGSVLFTPTFTCADGLYVGSPFVLPQTGTYTISLVPVLGGTGSISGQLFSVPADATQSVSIGGSSTTLSITAPGQHGSFSFSGTSGQKVSLLLDFTGMGSSCSTYTVLNPDSSVLFGPTYTCADGLFISSPFTLSQTGTYTIAIVPDISGGTATSGTGTITAQLFSVPADVTTSLTVGGSSTYLTISAPGQQASFTFSGTSGQSYTVNLDFSGMGSSCSTFSVLNPDNSTLTGPTFTCFDSYSTGSLPVSQTGTFTVAITPSLSNGAPTSGTGSVGAGVTSP